MGQECDAIVQHVGEHVIDEPQQRKVTELPAEYVHPVHIDNDVGLVFVHSCLYLLEQEHVVSAHGRCQSQTCIDKRLGQVRLGFHCALSFRTTFLP